MCIQEIKELLSEDALVAKERSTLSKRKEDIKAALKTLSEILPNA